MVVISKILRTFAFEFRNETRNSSVHCDGVSFTPFYKKQHKLLNQIGSRCKTLFSGLKLRFSSFFSYNFHRRMRPENENANKSKYSKFVCAYTNETGNPTIEAFNIEKNAKNEAYSFILPSGLFTQFREFCKNNQTDDPHAGNVRLLELLVTNKN